MARNEKLIHASPDEVFDILADPRSYAYWVLGSQAIRDTDGNWPQQGTRFHHTIGIGPLRLKDDTVVEEVDPGRFLQLEVRTRPFARARVKLSLEPEARGTRVTMVEDPADVRTAFVFSPLTHLLMRGRNVPSLERLAELAEGRSFMPGEEPAAATPTLEGPDDVENPRLRARRQAASAAVATLGRGVAAGLAGGAAMTASTYAEMRVRGRAPSHVPAEVLARLFGVNARGERRKQRLGAIGHAATSLSLGMARAVLGRVTPGPRSAGIALFGLSLVPELVIAPALGAAKMPWKWNRAEAGISILHHAVFAAVANATYALLEDRQ